MKISILKRVNIARVLIDKIVSGSIFLFNLIKEDILLLSRVGESKELFIIFIKMIPGPFIS
jgi:hypothetical protein